MDISGYEIILLCVILSLEPGDIFTEREVTTVLLVAYLNFPQCVLARRRTRELVMRERQFLCT